MSGRAGAALRLFVAIDPPRETSAALLALAEALDAPDARMTPVEQVHLTAQFIGDTDPRDLAGVAESVRRSASGIGRFMLTPLRLVTLPRRGPARLVAAETDAPPPLTELHTRLAHRLARSPRARAADRFLPHLTLLRCTRPTPGFRVDMAVEAPPFEVASVRLMRSVLSRSGAVHTALESVQLD